MNSLESMFPDRTRKIAAERRKMRKSESPDNAEFWKQLSKDALLMLVVTFISGLGIAVVTSISIKGGW